MTIARFDPTGRYAFAGTSVGTVEVYNVRTKTVSSTLTCIGPSFIFPLFHRSIIISFLL